MLTKRRRAQALKKTQFAALRSVDYYEEIIAKIKSNMPAIQIATWIQTVKGDFTDKKRESLSKQIERLRRQVAPKDVVDRALIIAKEQEMGELASIVKESQYLLKINKRRIIRNEKTEAKSPISLQNQDRAMQIHIELISLNKEVLSDLGMLTKKKDDDRGTVNMTQINVNLSDDELAEQEEEVTRRIQRKLERVNSIRRALGKQPIGGGEGIPDKASAV